MDKALPITVQSKYYNTSFQLHGASGYATAASTHIKDKPTTWGIQVKCDYIPSSSRFLQPGD